MVLNCSKKLLASFAATAFVLCMAFGISSCGQTGPLYLPTPDNEETEDVSEDTSEENNE